VLGRGVRVASVSTGQFGGDDGLDTALHLSGGAVVHVLDVSGLSAEQWKAIV
jgi:hypothetical protein